MKTFILISWRNLWRHRRRSIVVIMSIAIGIVAMVFSMGFMNGINKQMVDNTISTSLGHIAIHQKGFQDNMKLQYNFNYSEKIKKIISGSEKIVQSAPKIKLQGMIKSTEAVQGVMIVGVNPEKEKHISKIYDYVVKEEDSKYLNDSSSNQILISTVLASKLDVLVGEKLNLVFVDKDEEKTEVLFRVVGMYRSPVESFDKMVVFVGLKKIQQLVGFADNLTEVTILIKDKKNVDLVKESLIKEISNPKLEVLSWKDMAPSLVKSVELFDKMMYVFFMIVFVTVIFSVINTLIMAIMERFHEIGVMKAIGTRPRWIFFMIMFESFNLGVVGYLVGIGAAMLLHGILSYTGLDLSFYMETMRAWGTGSVVYPIIRTFDLVLILIIVMLTTLTGALYPGVKAARIKPLEAITFI